MAYALFLDTLGTRAKLRSLPANYLFRADASPGDYYYVHRKFKESVLQVAQQLPAISFVALFADCMYFVCNDQLLFSIEARKFLYHLLHNNVPVRGGIGYGNFHFEQASHIATSTANINESSFYGSSIVLAHEAENCGLKGLRVFVHRSAANALANLYDSTPVFPEIRAQTEDDRPPPAFGATTIPIPDSEIDDVQHELCYIGDESVDTYLSIIGNIEAISGAAGKAEGHYAETRRTLERVRMLRNSYRLTWDSAASRYGIWQGEKLPAYARKS